MHRFSIPLLFLCFPLVSCDNKSESSSGSKEDLKSARSPREQHARREVPPYKRRAKPVPPGATQHTPEEVENFRQQAAGYARTNSTGFIDWAEKNFPGDDPVLESIYQAFITELLKKDSEAAITLAGSVPAGSHGQAYAAALYRGLAASDPEKAWALLKEGRISANPNLAVKAIDSAHVDAAGLQPALASYRANRPEAGEILFFASLATGKGLSRSDITFALNEVRTLEPERGYGGAIAGIIRNTPPAERDLVISFLADKPADTKYDLAYSAAATLMLDSGDPLAAAKWANRITSPDVKDLPLKDIRDRLASFDEATRGKVEEMLKNP